MTFLDSFTLVTTGEFGGTVVYSNARAAGVDSATSPSVTYDWAITAAFNPAVSLYVNQTGGWCCSRSGGGQQFAVDGYVGASGVFSVTASGAGCSRANAEGWISKVQANWPNGIYTEQYKFFFPLDTVPRSVLLTTCVPIEDSLHVYLNGVEQYHPQDWDLMPPDADHTTWWVKALVPMDARSGDLLEARYVCQVLAP